MTRPGPPDDAAPDPFLKPPPPSVWGQSGPPAAGTPWAPPPGAGWQAQPWRDPSVPSPDPWAPLATPPPPRRTGRTVVLAVMATLLLVVVGLGVLGAATDDDDAGGASGPGGVAAPERPGPQERVDGEPAYFRGEDGEAVGGGSPRGLALGTAALVRESQREADRLGDPRRGVRLLPSPRLRQVAEVGAPGSTAPTGGRFLLVDVTTTPQDAAAVVSANDFFLLLPDGARLREASSEAGWFDLWPSTSGTGWDAERTGTLVFDLPVGQDALLVYGDELDGATASWRVPGAAATPVAAKDLPGYFGD